MINDDHLSMIFVRRLDVILFFQGILHLKVNISSRAGLMSELFFECNLCEHMIPMNTSSSVTKRGIYYDVSRRAVYRSLETGGGYEGLSAFFTTINMSCISKLAYSKQDDNILEA